MRMKVLSITVDEKTLDIVDQIMATLGTESKSEAIRHAVRKYCEENPDLNVTAQQLKDLLEEYLERVE